MLQHSYLFLMHKCNWPPGATIFASYLNSITGLVNLVLHFITGLVKHLDAIQHETCFTCCSILDKAIVCLNSKKAVIKSLQQDLLFFIQKRENNTTVEDTIQTKRSVYYFKSKKYKRTFYLHFSPQNLEPNLLHFVTKS